MNTKITCTKDYYCTVTVSFHQFVWKRKPCLVSILHAAAIVLLNCIGNRSTDPCIPGSSVDYTCFRYKDPDPI